jgi:general L-amino acid transport system permease protein
MSGSLPVTGLPDVDDIRQPSSEVGVVGWLRHNLFSSLPSSVATILVGGLLLVGLALFADWAVADARWGVITSNMRLFLVGLYPPSEIWRVWVLLVVLSLVMGLSAGSWRGGAVRMIAIMVAAGQVAIALLALVSGLGLAGSLALVADAAILIVAMALTRRRRVGNRWLFVLWAVVALLTVPLLGGLGESGILPTVGSHVWGGLLLTLLLAVVSILLSFPFGVALALGRRSNMPVIRVLSTAFIELVRAVPLVTILFMAALLFPLFLPQGMRIDNVIRAMGGLTIFSAAYVAENVRGGLQAIPAGQVEAAQAIGLRGWQTNLFVVLPQALRMTIPANVGLFISLLKDTTLVVIIALLELLGVGRAVLAQPEWLGTAFEVYFFVGAVFFVLCYALSQASYRLERELGVGER